MEDQQTTPTFKAAFTHLTPLFLIPTVCLYVYLWITYGNFVEVMRNLFVHQVPLLVAQAVLAFARTQPAAEGPFFVADDDDDNWMESACVNPNTGLPMSGGMDAMGNSFGSGPDH